MMRQHRIGCDGRPLRLRNSFLQRSFERRRGVFRTSELLNLSSGTNLIVSESPEFSLMMSGRPLTTQDFVCESCIASRGARRKQLEVRLAGDELEIDLHYELFDEHPVVRKWMVLRNRSDSDLVASDLAWEKLGLRVSRLRREDVWTYYFTRRSKASAVDMDDCAICVNDESREEGFIIANEAPGCMKRFEIYTEGDMVSAMLNRSDETPFERVLPPEAEFKTPECFLLPYAGRKWQDVVDCEYRRFVEEHLTIMKPSKLPSVIYNNWYPFEGNVDREKLLAQIDATAELGFDMYQMDHGWSHCFGDWGVEKDRFPNGFEEIAEHVRKRGMKLGMWISPTAVHRESEVLRKHPEWVMKDANGLPWHMKGWDETYSMCLASDFKWHVIEKVDEIIKRYQVSLMKCDLSSVRNPYYPGEHAGCYATGHHHRNARESYLMIYEGLSDVFREVKRRNPECIMDLSFELYNVLDGTDLALVKVADMNWFTNQDNTFVRSVPWNKGSFRRSVYTRGRVVPPYTLNFGACSLEHADAADYGFFSVLTSHALFFGDLSKIAKDKLECYRKWFSWIREQRSKDDFYRYHRVSDVFPVPEGEDPRVAAPANRKVTTIGSASASPGGVTWDGVARVNEDGEGPIMFFRPPGCRASARTYRIPWAMEAGRYLVWDQNEERKVGDLTGRELAHRGIRVRIAGCPGAKVLVFSLAT